MKNICKGSLLRFTLPWVILTLSGCQFPPDNSQIEDEPSLTILWTGAIQGELDQCNCPKRPLGGLAKLATLIENQRTNTESMLLVDVGDFAGDPRTEDIEVNEEIARKVRAQITHEALELMNYQVFIPGERDLTLGALPLAEKIDASGAQMLTSNIWIQGDDRPLGISSIEQKVGSRTIRFLSALAPLSDEHVKAAAQGHDPNIQVLDPAAALSLALEGTDEDDFVVLFAHGPGDWARTLIKSIDGIDLCIRAHDSENPEASEQINDTILVGSGQKGEALGRVDIVQTGETITFRGSIFPVTDELDEDPEIAQLVDTLSDRLSEAQSVLDQANPEEPHPSGAEYVGFSACGECHSDIVQDWYDTDHVGSYQALSNIEWHTEIECFQCHTTGFGYAGGFRSHSATPLLSSVGCEACHGPSSLHISEGLSHDPVDESRCLSCHSSDNDPNFDFDVDRVFIAHSLSR